MPEIRLHWERYSNRLEARYKNRNLDLIHVYHQRWPVLRRKKKTQTPRGVEILTKSMLLEKDFILKYGDVWCQAGFHGSTFSPNTLNESKDHPKTTSCCRLLHFIWIFGSSSSINQNQKAGRQLGHESFRLPNAHLDRIAAGCYFSQTWYYTVLSCFKIFPNFNQLQM